MFYQGRFTQLSFYESLNIKINFYIKVFSIFYNLIFLNLRQENIAASWSPCTTEPSAPPSYDETVQIFNVNQEKNLGFYGTIESDFHNNILFVK